LSSACLSCHPTGNGDKMMNNDNLFRNN
jgi:hypothetical protein